MPLHHSGWLDFPGKGRDDANMRTTLQLDPDVAQKLEEKLREDSDASLDQIVNDALRIGLKPQPEYHAKTYALGVRSDNIKHLLEELEIESHLDLMHGRR